MKKQLTTKTTTLATILGLGALGTASSSAAIIIAGLDNWDSTTAPTVPHLASGVTATATASASTGNWAITDSGGDPGRGSSVDTTWGTFDGNGVAASAVTDVGPANLTVTNARPSAEVTLTIVNNGTADLDLAQFHMDVVAFRPKAPRTYALNVLAGSDITVGNVFTSGLPMNDNSTNAVTSLGGALGTGHDVHDDLDLDLSGLADHTLAVGETAIIQIAFSNGVGDNAGGHHLFLDNVAVSGDVAVPEPSSALLTLVSGAFLLRRRRK
ncbi:PEP-CTERM sorting domain-containing protein [Akkermansiaceae bacterium]|nr:PEP-CTERM sorting domain-containing protein [Akkermansiaceae bacterium]MDB4568247.1 PEP-CTERM sorting domain-containing protein [Akkermansiaceae bacterium]